MDTRIDAYMKELQRELRAFPAGRRREILDEVSEHIAQARAELESETEAAIRNVLDRLGEPYEIAAAARERFGVRTAKAGALEIVTLIALVIPFIGWLVGGVLVWMSRVWRTVDKVLTTILVPGVWLLLLFFTVAVRFESTSTSGPIRAQPGRPSPLPTPEPSSTEWVGTAALIAVYAVPVAVAIYLAIRARRLSDAAAAA
jgi:hypothetical protein